MSKIGWISSGHPQYFRVLVVKGLFAFNEVSEDLSFIRHSACFHLVLLVPSLENYCLKHGFKKRKMKLEVG